MISYRTGYCYFTHRWLLALAAAISLTALPASAQMIHTGKPDTAKKCAVCHFQWVNTFYNEQMHGDLSVRPEKKQVGTREMCISCHDGSIMDSRKSLFHGFEHRIGQKPSGNIRIPDTFPLDPDGKMQCATCHSPHALPSDTEKPYGLFLRAKNIDSSMCLICHEDKIGESISGNHPLNVKLPDDPGRVLELGGKTDAARNLICETCHLPHGAPNEKMLILPVKNTASRSILCESCHSDRPRPANGVSVRTTHPVNQKAKTARLPKSYPSGKSPGLGKNGEMVCVTCHQAHNAPEADGLLLSDNRQSRLCTACHEQQKALTGSSHDLRLSSPKTKNRISQKTASAGPCSACHLAHSGKGPLLWSRPDTNQTASADSLCLECHSRNGPAANMPVQNFSHKTGIALTAEMNAVDLPLYDQGGRKKPNGRVSCQTCHNVHDPRPILEQKDKNGIRRGNFLRLSSRDKTELCIHCHTSKIQIIGTDHDLSQANPDYFKSRSQKSRQPGVCFICHTAHHAKTQNFLWSAPLGPDAPQKWETPVKNRDHLMVRLCTGCHRENGIASEKVPERGLHPDRLSIPEAMIPSMTSGQSRQRLPLFQRDGKEKVPGNIVCSTCHDPHLWQASDKPEGHDRSEGNIFSSFLRPDAAATLCAGCHGEDGLFKYRYFHLPISRKTEKEPFPF